MLRIHNTLTRRKEDFVPLEAGRVRMYVCGITVYDYCHVGHGRMFVVFDSVVRWLRASHGKCRTTSQAIGSRNRCVTAWARRDRGCGPAAVAQGDPGAGAAT